MKLKTLQPRLKEVDTSRGIKTLEQHIRDRNGYPVKRASRWTKADNGRLLPLNSAAWKRLRASVLAEVPLCEYCPPGAITPAVAVDHRNNNPADNTRSNLVSTCTSCHSIKTAADMHGTVARLGCDVDGWPIAEGHHFNRRAVGPSDGLGDDATDAPEITSVRPPETDQFPSFNR